MHKLQWLRGPVLEHQLHHFFEVWSDARALCRTLSGGHATARGLTEIFFWRELAQVCGVAPPLSHPTAVVSAPASSTFCQSVRGSSVRVLGLVKSVKCICVDFSFNSRSRFQWTRMKAETLSEILKLTSIIFLTEKTDSESQH